MATSLQTLVDRTRNYLRDTPDYDQLTVSLNNSASTTTVQVADSAIYRARWLIEVDYETMMIRSLPTSLTASVTRAWRGSTLASHANSASVLIRPAFYAAEIIDAINDAVMGMFPYIYKPIVDTSLTVQTNQYQYVIPDMPGYTGYPIPYIYKLEILQPGDYKYRVTRRWEVGRGAVTSGSPSSSGGVASTYPTVKFKSLPPISATVRMHGYGPMPRLTNLTDTVDALFPPQCEYLIHKLAASRLLISAEAGRDRSDSGAVDRREEANRAGISLQTGANLLSQVERELLRTAMPPLPRHIKAVI